MSDEDPPPAPADEKPDHVVLLVHGIRDFGGWSASVKRELEAARPGVRAVPVQFGYYDVLSFLSPSDRSGKAYDKLLRVYDDVVRRYGPDVRVSVAAHSFGTFLTGRLLTERPNVRLHRILLCGSVLPQEYGWDNVAPRFDAVRNECGDQDPWPVYANIARVRYGNSGRHGFELADLAPTEHFRGGHSLFFEERHVRDSWLPFLLDGVRVQGNAAGPKTLGSERLSTWPFVTLLARLLLTLIWAVLYFWPVFLIALGLLMWGVYSIVPEPDPDDIDLGNYLRNIEQNATTQEAPVFERFIASLSAPSQAMVSFEAAIVEVGATVDGADRSREVVLLPADCAWIEQNPDGFLARFRDEELPEGTNFTALEPSGSTYRTARVTAAVENVLWFHGTGQGRIFADGMKLELVGEVECNPR